MPQEQPTREETLQKRKDFVPKLRELNEKVQIARHVGAPRSLQARPELDYGRDPRRAVSHQRTALSHCPSPREWVSRDELAELFTHLAISAGWPSAMTAVTLAMEVLAESE